MTTRPQLNGSNRDWPGSRAANSLADGAQRPAGLDPISKAQIEVPRTRPGTLSRPGLGELVSTKRPAIAAVSAPAGYGKSTLMVEWILRDPRKSAWVSLTRSDNDPVHMLLLVATAVDELGPVSSAIFDDLASPGVSILAQVVPLLAASLLAAEPFLLVLDDLHEVENQESRDALTLLFDHLPSGSTVAATSRAEIWLRLAHRRSRGEVLEVGPRELSFDVKEAAQVLTAAGVQLAPETVRELHRRTEGWPAGLYLGALALRDAPDPAKAVEKFAGDDRFIADYLRSEILDRAASSVRTFLTRTAVLQELSGSLCDHVLDSSGSAETLDALEQANRFLVPLDHRRKWYRYHQLFQDLLGTELARAEPQLVPELHRRAADWYEAKGRPEAAIEHAQASGDRDRTANLVGRWIRPAYFSGRMATVDRWLASLTGAEIESYGLAILASGMYAFAGHTAEALRWADVAEHASFTASVPEGFASIESARALLRANLCPNGAAAMVADAELAESQEPPWSPYLDNIQLVLVWARHGLGTIPLT